jgi:hypothetical protein
LKIGINSNLYLNVDKGCDNMDNNNIEIDEAIMAGRIALQALDEAERNISSARNWGVLDLFGGGFLSSMLKHSKMDDAQRCIERAQYALQTFEKELADVQMSANIRITTDGMTRFFDIWCDNFLADLVVQSRIKEAQDNIRIAKRNVRETINKLELMR